ncbi:hypothetical protein LR48_Vigan05g091100 [Vigna angularis]|uniref:Uncharacterized protein n=2 Tax=Phaseolus angularis TaxID=3914 RepID=A0A0L9UL56_PHAAN|nr:hypothetical protein LR48_Vigan05g091100 [Vigna angularis]BAU03121.1 hypothetical protein VIGAN_UM014600 [Vigna angularis var. angularis]
MAVNKTGPSTVDTTRVRAGSSLELSFVDRVTVAAIARGLGQSHRGFSLKLSFDDNGGQRLGHDRICDEPSTARAFNGAGLQRRRACEPSTGAFNHRNTEKRM